MAGPNWDQSLYSRRLSKATRAMSDRLSERYHRVEHLDRDGSYGLCTTLRAKLRWLEERGA